MSSPPPYSAHDGAESSSQSVADTDDAASRQETRQERDRSLAADALALGSSDEVVPPPAYGDVYGDIQSSARDGLGTKATVTGDGRINIRISSHTKGLSTILTPVLRQKVDLTLPEYDEPPPYIPPTLAGDQDEPFPPPLNVVIHVVGSRGDVQPFVALGKVLKEKYNHRVRLATHPTFKNFVEENGLEFFSIAGDPAELMAFMVKNPGLMPGFESLRNGDVGKRRKEIGNMIRLCWRSCIEAGDGSGDEQTDKNMEDWVSTDSGLRVEGGVKPFVADAIIANPPSFAHVHCAEKLGIPLHMMFTMPWSPTQSFPHPLANIQATNADTRIANLLSYGLVEMLTWQGLGDVINRFRVSSLGLDPLSGTCAPGMLSRMRVPWTYCWSPALISKPKDWQKFIDISGFYFLSLASSYTPAPDLAEFLDAGPPPVYIGFGSIVVDDPDAMTRLIFDAVKMSGQRALVSKGWGGFGAEDIGIPEGVFMLGNVPHDWLFKRVSCVVHHGGAGTTAAGIAAGTPTIVVPFFGDQPFWGAMVARAGAGPDPIPNKDLTAEKLAEAIKKALEPSTVEKAKQMSERIANEKGTESGAQSFHRHLDLSRMRCTLCPERTACWRLRRTNIKLSAFAVAVLSRASLLKLSDLKIYRPREHHVEDEPIEPISGAFGSVAGTMASIMMGVADMPVQALSAMKFGSDSVKAKRQSSPKPSTTGPDPQASTPSRKESSSTPRPESPTPSTLSSATSTLSPARSTSGLPPPSINLDAPTEETSGAKNINSDIPSEEAATAGEGQLPENGELLHAHTTSELQDPDLDDDRSSTLTPTPSDPGPRSASPTNSTSDSATVAADKANSDATSTLSTAESRSSQDLTLSPETTTSSKGKEKKKANFSVGDAVATSKGVGRIVRAGLKSPMDFSLAMSKGFRNVPKLYGDDTVRELDKVTDLNSGFVVAGKEFGLGFYDGISGLITQPIRGARKEGALGLVKGVGKGVGGLVLKPSAATWAITGYTMQGIYKELHKRHGGSVENYIIASRTAQGFQDLAESTDEERVDVIRRWREMRQIIRRKKNFGQAQLEELQSIGVRSRNRIKKTATRETASTDPLQSISSRSETDTIASSGRLSPATEMSMAIPNDMMEEGPLRPPEEDPQLAAEFEEAVRRSMAETTLEDPEEDEMVARAIRISVEDLEAEQAALDNDPELRAAMAASLEQATNDDGRLPLSSDSDVDSGFHTDTDEEDETEQLRSAPQEPRPAVIQAPGQDEELQTAIQESRRAEEPVQVEEQHLQTALQESREAQEATRDEDTELETALQQSREEQHEVRDEDEELRQALEQSRQVQEELPEDEEEALQRAIRESEERAAAEEEARREEERMMEYMIKQSLAEEEERKKSEPSLLD